MNFLVLAIFLFASSLMTVDTNTEILLKSTGALHFYDNEHILKIELDLKTYYANAELLYNNTQKLDQKCAENPNITDCDFFKNKLREVAEYAINETKYLQSTRSERELCLLVSALAGTITLVISSFFLGAAIATSAHEERIEQQNIQHNITIKQFDHEAQSLNIQNKSIHTIFYDVNALRVNFTETQYINQLITSTLFIIDKHNTDTNRYLSALDNNLKQNFFKIIDIFEFNNTLRKIKSDSSIFSLQPKDILTLSSVDSELINDTIIINVHIPLISKEKFDLINLVPIPITRDGHNFILNLNSKFIVKNDTSYAEISLATLAECFHATKLIICNSLLLDQILPMGECAESIIKNMTTTPKCTYKKLPNKTFIIKTSEESIYVHTVQPIHLKISCGLHTQTINVTKNMEILHKKNCKIYNNKNHNRGIHTTLMKIESEFAEPNFEIYENKTWSNNILFLNQYNNEMQHLFREFKQTEMDFKRRSKLLDSSKMMDFSNFFNVFTDIVNYIIVGVVMVTLVIIIAACRCIFSK